VIHLFLKTCPDSSPQRKAEFAEAIRRNIACRHIDNVVEISEPAQMPLRDMLALTRSRVGWADVAIIASGDIYFDDTAILLNHIGYTECFALSTPSWVFRGPPPDLASDCDDQLIRLLQEAGYTVYDPSLSIKSHSIHADGIRHDEPRCVPPCRIEQIRQRASDPVRKPGTVAIIQFERLGDIASELPIAFDLVRQGHEVSWYVSRECAPLLEGVSYVKPIIWDGPNNTLPQATAHAKAQGFDYVLPIQPFDNPDPSPRKLRCLAVEAWARAGVLDEFHILPCVFDRARSPMPSWKPPGDKPILAYALDARTSPYPDDLKQRLLHWLQENFSADFSFLPITPALGPPDALANVLRQVKVLISVDTFPLHMSYASGTPTIAITALGGAKSEPRRNWILKLDYGETGMADGLEKIAASLHAVLAGTIEPGRLIVQPQDMPSEPSPQRRILSILIPAGNEPQVAMYQRLDGLVAQLVGHPEIEAIVDTEDGPLWQKRNRLLQRAGGEYCCFVDPQDSVAGNYIPLLMQALQDRPDCVGLKTAHVANGKLQSVEIHSIEESDSESGISPHCPIKTQIVKKIAFGPGGDEEFAAKLSESGLLETENLINLPIYFKPAPT
jgi:hypothetical protein